MTDKPNDGGPAYPTLHIPDSSPPAWSGMSLRDYFAGQALAGIMTTDIAMEMHSHEIASEAYHRADAMLAERDKED